MKEKKEIINARYMSLNKIVQIVHCGKYDQFKNIVITNLKDNYANKFDDKKKFFEAITKNEALNDLVSYRLSDIEWIFDELVEENKVDSRTKELVETFLDKINNNAEPFFDANENTKFPDYKAWYVNDLNILLYNNNAKITKGIASLITKNEQNNTESVEI
jgi:formate dehydrogenase maturation protein FdhE